MNIFKKQNLIKKISSVSLFFLILFLFFTSSISISFFDYRVDKGDSVQIVININKPQVLATESGLDSSDTSNKVEPSTSSAIAGWLSWSVLGISNALGKILTFLLSFVVALFKWQDFNIKGVTTGWAAVRDICNMFFILVLLFISFATILKIENYNVKKLLPKLLIMAVLINFSKTICFLLIDFSQVIMLTFVSTFASGGHFIAALNLEKLNQMPPDSTVLKNWDIFGALFLSLIFIIISFCVFATFAAILLMRIIIFWMLIVLSPLAFLSFALPGGGYFSKWWGEFSKYLLVGPVLAFFTWLSLVIINDASKSMEALSQLPENEVVAAMSGIGTWQYSSTFLLATAMLVGALKITQSLGAMGGGIGMNMAEGLKNRGLSLGRGVAGLAGKGAKELAGFGVDQIQKRTGVDLNLARVYEGVKEKRREIRAERYGEGMQKAREVMTGGGRLHGLLAMTGTPGTAWEQIFTGRGIMDRVKGGKYRTEKKERLDKELGVLEKEKEDTWTSEAKDSAIISLDDKRDSLQDIERDIDLKGQDVYDTSLSSEERDKVLQEVTDLEKQKDTLQSDITKSDSEIKSKTVDDDKVAELGKSIEEKQEEISKQIPIYDFEARAAEQKLVSEKSSKIKDIIDASELLGILEDAIKVKDKSMIKAITKKMAFNGDDNEYLQPLVGNTGFKGVQKLMKGLSDKDNKELYAGFSEQEAFALGSEISMANKGTNHWGAVSAYKMEDGAWIEASEKEHLGFRISEVGKMHPQARARSLNRLGYGFHDEDGTFHLDIGGIMTLKTFDTHDGLKQFEGNLNESAAKYLGSPESMKKIMKAVNGGIFSSEIPDIIKRALKATTIDHDAEYDKIKKALEKV